ncbi:MAG: hypothetical protein WDM92_15150 [Caulobacteraceae bacterium]
MAVAQVIVALGLLGMGRGRHARRPDAIGAFALVVAFASSTQDIVVDAWRIEARRHPTSSACCPRPTSSATGARCCAPTP